MVNHLLDTQELQVQFLYRLLMKVKCIDNGGYIDLIVGKTYGRISDPKSELDGFLRVIDDSGEDYLYPARWFVDITPSTTHSQGGESDVGT